MGLLLVIVVHAASVQDYHGARLVMMRLRGRFPRLSLVWADGGYAFTNLVDWAKRFGGWVLETVKKPADQKGFVVLPRRWVVERTFAWLGRYRRLSKDYEFCTQSSETMVYLAMTHLMLNRLKHAQPAQTQKLTSHTCSEAGCSVLWLWS